MEVHTVVDLVVFFCTSVASCFGNSLVMISVKRFEYLQEPTFYFVVMLAFYDFCHGAPLFVVVTKRSGIHKVLCSIYVFLGTFGTVGDMVSILVISIDRCVYINWPL